MFKKVIVVDDNSFLFERLLLALCCRYHSVVVISFKHRPYSIRRFVNVTWQQNNPSVPTNVDLLFLLQNIQLNSRVLQKIQNQPSIISLAPTPSLDKFQSVVMIRLAPLWGLKIDPKRIKELLEGLVFCQPYTASIHVSNAVIALLKVGNHLLKHRTSRLQLYLRDTNSFCDSFPVVARSMGLSFFLFKGKFRPCHRENFQTVTCNFTNHASQRKKELLKIRQSIHQYFALESGLSYKDTKTFQNLLKTTETMVRTVCLVGCHVALTTFVLMIARRRRDECSFWQLPRILPG